MDLIHQLSWKITAKKPSKWGRRTTDEESEDMQKEKHTPGKKKKKGRSQHLDQYSKDLAENLERGKRCGKCISIGTLVKTPTGSRPIEELNVGDTVYGYNADETISTCRVTAVYDQGIKEVVDMLYYNRVVVSATRDHKFMSFLKNNVVEETVAELLTHPKNSRKLAEFDICIPGGDKTVQEAYAIGALLGDGCCLESGLRISSKDYEVVAGVAHSLSCSQVKKITGVNYTWSINRSFHYKSLKDEIPYYRKWCHNKYAHEKYCDLEVIRSWDRSSQLDFIAGLVDTDGSVYVTQKGRLQLRIAMQAKSVIDVVSQLFMDLFQVQVSRHEDTRAKYVNGPVHTLIVGENRFSKRILLELPTKVPRKQWKEEYADLPSRSTKFIGVREGQSYKTHCFDISVDNDSNLYLLSSGVVTHNSYIAKEDDCHQNENDIDEGSGGQLETAPKKPRVRKGVPHGRTPKTVKQEGTPGERFQQPGTPEQVETPEDGIGMLAGDGYLSDGTDGIYDVEGNSKPHRIYFPAIVDQAASQYLCSGIADLMNLASHVDYLFKNSTTEQVGAGHEMLPFVELDELQLGKLAQTNPDIAGWFVHSVLVRNETPTGANFDNMILLKNGRPTIRHFGGCLLWTEMGNRRPDGMFPEALPELQSLRSSELSWNAAAVFGQLTDEQVLDAIQQYLVPVNEKEILDLVDASKFAPDDRAEIGKGLIMRKRMLESMVGENHEEA